MPMDENVKQRVNHAKLFKYYNLEEFWENMPQESRDAIIEWDGDTIDSEKLSLDKFQFMKHILMILAQKKQVDMCNAIINYIEQGNVRPKSIIDFHYYLTECIGIYYRPKDPDMYNPLKTISYCKMDISIFPRFKEAYTNEEQKSFLRAATSIFYSSEQREQFFKKAKEYKFNLGIPSFKILTIQYEKMGRYQDAINVCKKALEYGLDDDTKGGYTERITRLEKKIKG